MVRLAGRFLPLSPLLLLTTAPACLQARAEAGSSPEMLPVPRRLDDSSKPSAKPEKQQARAGKAEHAAETDVQPLSRRLAKQKRPASAEELERPSKKSKASRKSAPGAAGALHCLLRAVHSTHLSATDSQQLLYRGDCDMRLLPPPCAAIRHNQMCIVSLVLHSHLHAVPLHDAWHRRCSYRATRAPGNTCRHWWHHPQQQLQAQHIRL